MDTLRLERVDHVNIVVSDLNSAVSFFQALGFSKVAEATLSGDWISSVTGLPNVKAYYVGMSLPDSPTILELIEYLSPRPERSSGIDHPNNLGIRHIAFVVKDIEKVIGTLKERGVKFVSELQVFPANGKKLAYFLGPDEILLELAEYVKAPGTDT